MTMKIDGTNGITFPNNTVQDNGKGPAFSAFKSVAQSITHDIATQVTFETEEYDYGNCYNSTASTVTLNGLSVPAYSFCPNVAGVYHVNFAYFHNTSSNTYSVALIYKNGADFRDGPLTAGSGPYYMSVSTDVYLNGTGDYITAVCNSSGANYTVGANGGVGSQSQRGCFFQSHLVRAA